MNDEIKEILDRANKQIQELTNNWNELEEWLKQQLLISLRYEIGYYKEVLDKMKEIKEGNNVSSRN